MNTDELLPLAGPYYSEPSQPLLVEVVPRYARSEPHYEPSPRPRSRPALAAALFLATCVTTFVAGVFSSEHTAAWWPAILDGATYSAAVMTILLCHEMGHYLQARRYGVSSSLPYFIPMPFPPIGTCGAVIVMEPRRGNLKQVFDIGISGPLAGLVPTLAFLWLGLSWSYSKPVMPNEFHFGSPLLVSLIFSAQHGPLPAGHLIAYHPLALAGWVGLLVTSINLIPIGQLDGGHILYGMIRKQAHLVSTVLLLLATALSIGYWLPHWWLLIALIAYLGTRHPPTADDSAPLGSWRYALGLATLAFIILGFTPVPIGVPSP